MSTAHSGNSSRRLLNGALAGFVATDPMSLAMLVGWLFLPRCEKYHLPPRLITEEITERLGMGDEVSERQLIVATVASHFGYGAVSGALYALFEGRLPFSPSLNGALAGLAVWGGSYLGWLPSLGILSSATKHPWRRNLLMILAHIVWGATLAEMTRKLTSRD